jgi:ABC-type polysaccharide transport system permease subunit
MLNMVNTTWGVRFLCFTINIMHLVMFIFVVGRLMNEGFDQISNMNNVAVRSVSETLDMYICNIFFEVLSISRFQLQLIFSSLYLICSCYFLQIGF